MFSRLFPFKSDLIKRRYRFIKIKCRISKLFSEKSKMFFENNLLIRHFIKMLLYKMFCNELKTQNKCSDRKTKEEKTPTNCRNTGCFLQ